MLRARDTRESWVTGCYLPKSGGVASEPRMYLWADCIGHGHNRWKRPFPVPRRFYGSLLPCAMQSQGVASCLYSWSFGCPRCGPRGDKPFWLVGGHAEHLYSHWDCDSCFVKPTWCPRSKTESNPCVSDSTATLRAPSIVERELTFPEQSFMTEGKKSQQRVWPTRCIGFSYRCSCERLTWRLISVRLRSGKCFLSVSMFLQDATCFVEVAEQGGSHHRSLLRAASLRGGYQTSSPGWSLSHAATRHG